eukprot:1161923-Pelagomonas_calceolata.AAC.15
MLKYSVLGRRKMGIHSASSTNKLEENGLKEGKSHTTGIAEAISKSTDATSVVRLRIRCVEDET